MTKSRFARPLTLVLLLGAVLLPFFTSNFLTFQITVMLVYAIAILGLVLLTGYNGQISLGHSAFYAIGAYTAAILIDQLGMPYVWTIPVAGALCFVAGFLFGLPALRLEGVYLALATFALAVAVPQILKISILEHFTGGVQGIVIAKPEAPFGLPLTADQWLYLFTLAFAFGAYVLASNLVASRTGRAWMAIRDNPIAARTMGVDLAHYKTLAFGISAMFTGVAGALSAIVIQYVSPDSFAFHVSITLLVGAVVGGISSIGGALFGGLFVLFVPNIAEGISKGLSSFVYGVILILLIYLMPSGFGGLGRRLWDAIGRQK